MSPASDRRTLTWLRTVLEVLNQIIKVLFSAMYFVIRTVGRIPKLFFVMPAF